MRFNGTVTWQPSCLMQECYKVETGCDEQITAKIMSKNTNGDVDVTVYYFS